jgi:hypothetical protein
VLHRAARTAGSGLKSNPPEHWPRAVEGIIGSTIDAIGRPALRDIYNATLGDRMTLYRITNLANVFRRIRRQPRTCRPKGEGSLQKKPAFASLRKHLWKTTCTPGDLGKAAGSPLPPGLPPTQSPRPWGAAGADASARGE